MGRPISKTRFVPPPASTVARVKSGIHSELILSTSADIVQKSLMDACPWIVDTDAIRVRQYCQLEAKSRLLNDHIMRLAIEQGVEVVPIALWAASTNLDLAAMRAADSLGLSPEGRMKIAKDSGFAAHFAGENLKTLLSEGAEIRRVK